MIHSGMTMQGQSHVAEPSVNLGDSSFLNGIGGPGFLTEQMNDFEHDGRITNSSGQTEPGSGSVNNVSGLSHVAWLAHQRVLGGWQTSSDAAVMAGKEARRGGESRSPRLRSTGHNHLHYEPNQTRTLEREPRQSYSLPQPESAIGSRARLTDLWAIRGESRLYPQGRNCRQRNARAFPEPDRHRCLLREHG